MSTTVSQDDQLERFSLWAIAQLGLKCLRDGDRYCIDLPEEYRDGFDGREQVFFQMGSSPPGDEAAAEPLQALAPGEPLFEWLVERLHRYDPPPDARPRVQPDGVHDISSRLFPAYHVDGGSVHLSGCTIEDVPILRLTYLREGQRIEHVLIGEDGQLLTAKEIAALQLDEIVPCKVHQPRLSGPRRARLLELGRRRAAELGERHAASPPLCRTVLWCKYAQGRLCFTIGGSRVQLPFSGWAQTLEAPPFVCPLTGARSFQVAATDDGRITVAIQIAACEITGKRVLHGELVTCAATGQRVLPECTEICSVTGEPVVRDAVASCNGCAQQVAPKVLTDGVCQACREMAEVSKDDPRIARVLGEHPGLDSYRTWKLSETATAYVLCAGGWIRQLLAVIDKQSLEVRHLARRHRLLNDWVPVPEPQWKEILD
ncbi:MAG: hypothetical protein WDZ59_16060 [Pirellulales bacterium]